MESEFIRWLRDRVVEHPAVAIGPGDDAALLAPLVAGCVVTTDLLTDGVDFELQKVDPRRIGRKALAVNLSDLAAMAAEPVAAVIALALPRSGALHLAQELYEGLLPLAARYQVAIAGGDTNTWDGRLVIAITLLGRPTPRGVLTRRGARPGDRILVTGSFGGSILGRHFEFEPRVHEALRLNELYELRAGMDVSDGLSLDLLKLARESGCGAVLDLERVPVAEAAECLADELGDGTTPLDHALTDGEDFELILAVAPEVAERILHDQPLDVTVTEIGEFVAERGLWKRSSGGGRRPMEPGGFEHRSDP